MKCPKCKHDLRDRANFCSNCGLKLTFNKQTLNFKVTDTSTADLKVDTNEAANNAFIEKKTFNIIKEKCLSIDFPEKDCARDICSIELPVFKDLRRRDIEVSFRYKDFERLMEKEGIKFRDGIWKKDFEGICALCSLEDTPDLVYHCVEGKNKDKFCCELHGFLTSKKEMSGIYFEFVFPEWWEKADLETWKENMKKTEENRVEKTMEYYKTAMMDKCYCCSCDKEIEYIEHYENNGLCKLCKGKKEISESEKLWQREISKYKIGSLFKVTTPSEIARPHLKEGHLYKLTRKKGKRVYLGKVDDNRKIIKGKGDWYLGIPACFRYQTR